MKKKLIAGGPFLPGQRQVPMQLVSYKWLDLQFYNKRDFNIFLI